MDSGLLPMHRFLFSMDPILPLTLVVSLPGCATACPALLDICCQMTASILRCPFSQYSVFPRQGPYWETNVHAGRIVLHLKSVIWDPSATRFRNSQSGFKTRDDDGFGIRPLCLIFFICSNHVWNLSYCQADHKSISARRSPDEGFCDAVRELV